METVTQVTVGQSVQIGRRNFVVDNVHEINAVEFPNAHNLMVGNGWEPTYYLLVGKRGASVLAYRNAKWGTLVTICNI